MKKVKADEYFGNEYFETARFGNIIVTHNNMTEEQHKEWVAKIDSVNSFSQIQFYT